MLIYLPHTQRCFNNLKVKTSKHQAPDPSVLECLCPVKGVIAKGCNNHTEITVTHRSMQMPGSPV